MKKTNKELIAEKIENLVKEKMMEGDIEWLKSI